MNIQQTVLEFPAAVNDLHVVLRFLEGCAGIMKVIPSTYHLDMFPSKGVHPIGFTATVSFQESYCAIDTWPEEEYCHLNLVSCKRFGEAAIISLIHFMFGVDPEAIIQFDVFKRPRAVGPDGT